jgi:hypothetical protein
MNSCEGHRVFLRAASGALALALASYSLVATTAEEPAPREARNLRIIGHSDLNGRGNGGEGLDLEQYAAAGAYCSTRIRRRPPASRRST